MKRAYLQLGRLGDIASILPLVWEDSRSRAQRPHVIVAKEFASILDGVSYAIPHVWTGAWEDVAGAVKEADGIFDEIFVTQVHGNYLARSLCDSYCRDMWAQIGRLDWGCLPLVFDLRDEAREAALSKNLGGIDGSAILVATLGNSSPYDPGDQLRAAIQARFPKNRVVNLDPVKGERVYDLLGLMDQAGVLVTIDTVHMHLAHASSIPVVALVSPAHNGWGATSRYPGQVFRCPYTEIGKRKEEMLNSIEAALSSNRFRKRRLIHSWNDRLQRDLEAARRHTVAKSTWEREYRSGHWLPAPALSTNLHNTSEKIGDPRPVPLINDIVEHALGRANPNDLIVLTNEDISFIPGITDTLMTFTGQCAWAHRYDFKSIKRPVDMVGAAAGHKYPGIDFFVFTPAWWKEQAFPPLYIGRQRWDLCVKTAMRLSEGQELAVACAHEQHPSYWSTGNAENNNPANQWNYRATEKWLLSRGIQMEA